MDKSDVDVKAAGLRIRHLRIAKGLNQPELAELLGVTKATISKWESGQIQEISAVNLAHLAEVLGTDHAYILWGPDRVAPWQKRAGSSL